MTESHNLFNSLQSFDLGNGNKGHFYSLPAHSGVDVGHGDESSQAGFGEEFAVRRENAGSVYPVKYNC